MCINIKGTPKATGFGWKVFVLKGSPKRCCTIFQGETYRGYKIRKWHKATKKKVTFLTYNKKTDGGEDQSYTTGFHIFKRKKYAREYLSLLNRRWPRHDYEVKKIKYRGARHSGETAIGFLGDEIENTIIVADEMLILK